MKCQHVNCEHFDLTKRSRCKLYSESYVKYCDFLKQLNETDNELFEQTDAEGDI